MRSSVSLKYGVESFDVPYLSERVFKVGKEVDKAIA